MQLFLWWKGENCSWGEDQIQEGGPGPEHISPQPIYTPGRCHIRQGQRSSPLSPLWFLELFGSSHLKRLGQGGRSLPWCPGSRFWWFICNLSCWKGVSTWGRAAGAEQCLGTQIPPVWTPFFAQGVDIGCGCRDWAVSDGWKAATVCPSLTELGHLSELTFRPLVHPLCPFLRELS